MGTPEGRFQKKFIDELKEYGFKCIRVKASGNSNKSYPDYAVFYRRFWAWLEFKKSRDAKVQPGQEGKVEWANRNSFGAFVYPENAADVRARLMFCKNFEDAEHRTQCGS